MELQFNAKSDVAPVPPNNIDDGEPCFHCRVVQRKEAIQVDKERSDEVVARESVVVVDAQLNGVFLESLEVWNVEAKVAIPNRVEGLRTDFGLLKVVIQFYHYVRIREVGSAIHHGKVPSFVNGYLYRGHCSARSQQERSGKVESQKNDRAELELYLLCGF